MTRAVIELAVVLGAAGATLVLPNPLVPMVAAASLVLWIGGGGWASVGLRGGEGTAISIAVGAGAGLVGLATLAVVDPPALAAGQVVAARGNVEVAMIALALAVAAAFAAEMVRGFVIDRLSVVLGDRPILAVIGAALVWSALFSGGEPRRALGVTVASVGFGLLYVAANKRMGAAIAAHVVYEVGAVVAVAARLV